LSQQITIKVKPSQALAAHRSEIREIVLAQRADNTSVFGSVAKGLDSEESDLDILVDPTPDTTLYGYFKVDLKIVWKTIENDLQVL
jgi:predicted nucleotidyltransferase